MGRTLQQVRAAPPRRRAVALALTLGALVTGVTSATGCGDQAPAGPAVVAGKPVGEVKEVTGTVRVVRAGQERAVRVGEPVSGDDEVRTGADGRIAVVLWHNQVIWQVGPDQRRVVGESLAWRAPRAAGAKVAGPDVVSAPAGRHVEREAADTSASAGAEAAATATADRSPPRAMIAPPGPPPTAAPTTASTEPERLGGGGRANEEARPDPTAEAPKPFGSGQDKALADPPPEAGGLRPGSDDGAGDDAGSGSTESAKVRRGDDKGAGPTSPGLGTLERRPAPPMVVTKVRSGPIDAKAAQAALVSARGALAGCGLGVVTLVITVRGNGTVAKVSGTTSSGAALAATAVRCVRDALGTSTWPRAAATSVVTATVR